MARANAVAPSRSRLNAERRSYDAQMAQCQAEGSGIEEKIARLNEAKRKVAPIDENVDSVRSWIRWERDVDRWKGYRRGTYDEHTFDVDDVLRAYTREASDLYAHICDQITALENQRHDNEGVRGWLTQRLNDVQNELDKLVN